MRGRDRAALVLVAITLAFGTLAIGGAPRWSACITSLLGLATAVPYLTSRRASTAPSRLLWPLGIAAGLTGLQLLPLPAWLAEQVAPEKLDLVTANARAWGERAPAWVNGSFDPPATLVELAKLSGYVALAYTCARLAASRTARRWLAAIVAGTATIVALVTLAHLAVGATRVFGLYQPSFAMPLVGPFISPNHLASLMTLSAPLALVLALTSAGIQRGSWVGSCLVLIGTGLLTASRGGVISLLAGMTVVIVILLVQRRAGTDEGRQVPIGVTIPAVIVSICTLLLLALLTAGDAAQELQRTSIDEVHEEHSKFQLWARATDLAERNRWLGIGRGAFETAYTASAETGNATYSHAENEYLQSVVDWGVPGAALLALALAMAAGVALRRWRHGPIEAGALGAIAAVAVHDLADFSLQLPGIAMSTIVGASILFPARVGTAADVAGKRLKLVPRAFVAARSTAIAAGGLVILLAASPLGRTARADADEVLFAADATTQLQRAHDALDRHPSDYVAAGRAASALFSLGDQRAVRMIERALVMNPHNGGLHHLAARILARSQRRDQSAVEFSLAARWSRDLGPIVTDVVRIFDTPAEVAAAFPAEPSHAPRVVEALGTHPNAAVAYAKRVADAYPTDTSVQATLAVAAVHANRPDLAVPAARIAWELAPVARHASLYAGALNLAGQRQDAIRMLQDAVERTVSSPTPDRLTLFIALSELDVQEGNLEAAKAALQRADSLATGFPELRRDLHLRAADIEDRLGNSNQAEWERDQARRISNE